MPRIRSGPGEPPPAGSDQLIPTPDRASARISGYITDLSSTGIDAGTPHAMDNLIRGWSLAWVTDVDLSHQQRHTELSQLVEGRRQQQAALADIHAHAERQRDMLAEAVHDAHQRLLRRGDDPTTRAGESDLAPMASRPWHRFAYLGVLCFAGAVDIVAFVSVIELVMPQSPAWMVAVFVAGLTVLALTLTHLAGQDLRIARQRAAGRRLPGGLWPLYTVIWLAMGLTAFAVRLLIPDATTRLDNITDVPAPPAPAVMWIKAALFLAIYVGSGVIAISVALRHDPEADAFRRLQRAHARAVAATITAHDHLAQAASRLKQGEASLLSHLTQWETAREQMLACARILRAEARTHMAVLLKNAPDTDGLTGLDEADDVALPPLPVTPAWGADAGEPPARPGVVTA